MGFLDILEQYAQGGSTAADAHAGLHFDEVAAQAPREAVGGGIAAALRSGAGGSLASSVEKHIGSSNDKTKAGVLSHLIQAVEPAVLSSMAGGALARLLPGISGGASSPTPQDADAVSPAQAGELAAAAEQRDPSVIDRVGSFYAQHPTVVKALGAAALAIAMNHMANRTRT